MLQMLLYLLTNLRESLLMQRRHPSSSLSKADALRHDKLVSILWLCMLLCMCVYLAQLADHSFFNNQTKAD